MQGRIFFHAKCRFRENGPPGALLRRRRGEFEYDSGTVRYRPPVPGGAGAGRRRRRLRRAGTPVCRRGSGDGPRGADPGGAAEEALVATVSGVGAPSRGGTMYTSAHYLRALELLEQRLGKAVAAFIPSEMGGSAALALLTAAAPGPASGGRGLRRPGPPPGNHGIPGSDPRAGVPIHTGRLRRQPGRRHLHGTGLYRLRGHRRRPVPSSGRSGGRPGGCGPQPRDRRVSAPDRCPGHLHPGPGPGPGHGGGRSGGPPGGRHGDAGRPGGAAGPGDGVPPDLRGRSGPWRGPGEQQTGHLSSDLLQ